MDKSHSVKRKWLWRAGLLAALYAVLWEFTHLAGMPTVYRSVIAGLPIDASYAYTDVPGIVKSGKRGPVYFCRATACAPFVVRVDYGWQSGSRPPGGGSALYLWFFGITSRIHEIECWGS